MSTYKPHPSTIGYRVIEYLKTLPKGKMIATSPLCEAMEQPSGALITSLETAVKHGVIIRAKIDGMYHWGMPVEGMTPDQVAAAYAKQKSKPDQKKKPTVTEVATQERTGKEIDYDLDARVWDEINAVDMDAAHKKDADNARVVDVKPQETPRPGQIEQRPVEESGTSAPNKGPCMVIGNPECSFGVSDSFSVQWCSKKGITMEKGGVQIYLTKAELNQLLRLHVHMLDELPPIITNVDGEERKIY